MTQAKLLLPPQQLASCVAACVVRDTRGTALSNDDRINYFPASPMFAVTKIIEGTLHVSTNITDPETLRTTAPTSPTSTMPPQHTPIMSWSPGPIFAMTIAVYPDAWRALCGGQIRHDLPECLQKPLSSLATIGELTDGWKKFCDALMPIWAERRNKARLSSWPGSHRLQDWMFYMANRVTPTGRGASVRSIERRFRQWTGHSEQSLEYFAKIEELYRLRMASPDTSLAQLAADARYSDQSHMGRALKRATGFTPAQLNSKIDQEEAFWCYRLLGERF